MSLTVICGYMYAGKTETLLSYASKYKAIGKKIININYEADKRYSNTQTVSHSGKAMDAIFCNELKKIKKKKHRQNYDESEVILINEGQFFEDLIEVVDILVNVYKKEVYVCGLDGDFKRQKFGKILDLIPNCDEFVKLKALCRNCCQNDALFTYRLSEEKEQTVVGVDNYVSLCRMCYNKGLNCKIKLKPFTNNLKVLERPK